MGGLRIWNLATRMRSTAEPKRDPHLVMHNLDILMIFGEVYYTHTVGPEVSTAVNRSNAAVRM